MARRETFESALECPQCGNKGTATWEVNEAPAHQGAHKDAALMCVSEGFLADGDREPIIYCGSCKIAVSKDAILGEEESEKLT